ncbi:class I SAM-dependent methyltransferase [Candidatus Woesearchaeota archaeon]|nr:class I SAM-dependent methyltransferase [Candidatus Woesearchaeota archaeon]
MNKNIEEKIDWYKQYLQKAGLVLDERTFVSNIKTDRLYIQLLRKYLKSDAKILECGCGLGRTVMSMAHDGFRVVAIDHNRKMLAIAKQSATNLGLARKIRFIRLDLFDIDQMFKPYSFDCITHQGVVEHYSKTEIEKILLKQLKIAPILIFSVPLKTEFNERKYFVDHIYRNLWTTGVWLNDVLKSFNIVEQKVVKQRSDNLLIVIKESD